jgi:hypothetical protein
VRVAADAFEPVVVRVDRGEPGALVPQLRRDLEHIRDARELPWLPASVAVDVLPALRGLVVARRLVPSHAGVTPALRFHPKSGGAFCFTNDARAA